jgi:hypothetical protein
MSIQCAKCGDNLPEDFPSCPTCGGQLGYENETPTPLTDAEWVTKADVAGDISKATVDHFNQALTRKHGNPSRIADLERQLAEARGFILRAIADCNEDDEFVDKSDIKRTAERALAALTEDSQ